MVTILLGVVLFSGNGGVQNKFGLSAMHSDASGNVRYLGPPICEPSNTSPRCNRSPLVIKSPRTLPGSIQGQPYSYQFQVTGGTAPYSWETTTESNLDWYPCCLVSLSQGGLFASVGGDSGNDHMPYVGTYQVGVKVTDSAGRSATGVHQFTISPEDAGRPLRITGESALPDGNVGEGYYYHFQFSGGVGPYSWSIVPSKHAYPAGVFELSNSGMWHTPFTLPYAGDYDVTVRLTDSRQTVEKTFTFSVLGGDTGQKDQ